MKIKCLHCGHLFEGSVSHDDLGWHSLCPKCNQSFDVDLPEGQIIMAFADDSNPEKYTENFTDDFTGNNIKAYYAFDTPEMFIKKWDEMILSQPDSMWYWVLYKGKCICSGACDPNDEEIFYSIFDVTIVGDQ